MTPFGEDRMQDRAGLDPPDTALHVCWRCGLAGLPVRGLCPHCRARLTAEAPAASPLHHGMSPVAKVLIGFTVMLITSLVWGWVVHFSHVDRADLVTGTIALEIADAVLMLALWLWIGRVALPRPTRRLRFAAWIAAWPALGGVLAFNLGYNYALKQFLHPPEWLKAEPVFQGLTLTSILLIVIQPAVVEELFFRQLAFGALRQVSGLHAAVWISALMFALAHVYAPLGLPWLLFAGAVFGYARASGGLLLPMLLHGVHNLVVLSIHGGI